MRNIFLLAIAATCAALPAHADTAAHMAKELARYQKYAQPPVDRFPMLNIWQWQVVGKDKLVVWPTINTAYLLTVLTPCLRLEWTQSIGITQNTAMHVDRHFDSIVFDHQNCRISKIQPLDYKALLRDEKGARAGMPQDASGT